MNEYKRLELGSLVKLAVDSRGITNGSIDVLSFEYDINSEIDKIVDYVDGNNFPELKGEVEIIKQQNDILEDKIKNFALEVLTLKIDTKLLQDDTKSLQDETDQLNQLIQEYNTTVANQYNNLVNLTYQILNKLEPKIVYKDKIVIQKEYIETTKTFYRGVKSIDEVRQEKQVVSSGRRPKAITGWFEYSDEWMVEIIFDKESFFMTKKDYQRAINRGLPPGGIGPLVSAKLFHKEYDK
jgi:hypothetical protein